MNQIVIKGRCVKTPTLSKTASGKAVTNFDVAVRRPASKDLTDFFKCIAWEKTAEFVTKYFEKGQEIILVGCMQSRKYTDKNEIDRLVWEVNVSSVEFCGAKQNTDPTPWD